MLAALSAFVDGWTVDAASHVADLTDETAFDLLDALAGHSLVQVDATEAEPRFRMLESVRELAGEHLAASGELADVQRRHARFFEAFVTDADWPMQRQVEWAERLRAEEQNLRAAIRWFFDHEVTPLPHLFRVLWLFWQMRDRMPEGRGWIDELRARSDALDDHAQSELLFTSAVTAVEVGDDDSALATIEGLERLQRDADDPYLECAAQLALSWILPLVDDFDGALQAAVAAHEGFRRQDEPFVAFAALTVGLVEMTLGRHDEARAALTEVDELGGQLGNSWLQSAARTQLASLAVRTGRVDEGRSLLVAWAEAPDDTEHSTLTVTFALVARAELALAEGKATQAAMALGAADGLRQRKGLRAWPSTRRAEAELAARVAEQLDPEVFDDTLRAAAELSPRDAVTLVRGAP
jgi:tetratricopeptide (TPR) repeat protein